MIGKKIITLVSVLTIMTASNLMAQELIVYPSDGQPKEQQNKDEGECLIWARDNSGYDPINTTVPTVTAVTTAPTQHRGGAVRGALGGAAIGGIVDGSDGAENGAAIGALVGLGRQRRANNTAAAQQQQQAAAVNQQNADAVASAEADQVNFNRYYATCLEGRGYAVN